MITEDVVLKAIGLIAITAGMVPVIGSIIREIKRIRAEDRERAIGLRYVIYRREAPRDLQTKVPQS